MKISARCANSGKQGTSQKYTAAGVSVSDKKKMQLHPQLKHRHH
jgi:hypothetical protein